MSHTEFNEEVKKMRAKSHNKTCFDCGEKGVNYVVTDFGVFVCSTCSGIHRQINNKVKGLGMSNFDLKDVEKLREFGNKKGKEYWLADYNKTVYPVPERSNAVKMKEFLKLKYEQKRFVIDDDGEGGSKKSKKSKKKKKKREPSSSEEEKSEESSSESEEEKPTKIRRTKKKAPSRLAAPEPPS